MERMLRLLQLVLFTFAYIFSVAFIPGQMLLSSRAKERIKETAEYTDRVFAVHTPFGHGTGWVLERNENLFVVTAAHVCGDFAALISIEWGVLPVLHLDNTRDICVMDFSAQAEDFRAKGLSGFKLRTVEPLLFSKLKAISRQSPEKELSLSGNIIGFGKTMIDKWGFNYNSIKHTAPTMPGASGGPILDKTESVSCMTTMIFIARGAEVPVYGTCVDATEIEFSLQMLNASV
jgi:S1-C subfamily serine protease